MTAPGQKRTLRNRVAPVRFGPGADVTWFVSFQLNGWQRLLLVGTICLGINPISPKKGDSGAQVGSNGDDGIDPGRFHDLFDQGLRIHEHQFPAFFT